VPAAPPQEVRKLVTLLFCDLKGSTSLGERLDSESLREVMSRYFDSMSAAIAEHGGTIEKFIGDAVMAVFGLPRVHEDDALRAVRAARSMQVALAELNDELERVYGVRLANRIGVNTGEVVAGDPSTGQRLVTGDAVNVAARLEQAAGESEALLGELTYRLVRDHAEVDPVEPLELKGKAERVPAWRLVALRAPPGDGPARGESLVGRDAELTALEAEYHAAVQERGCRLVTVLAEAGVGKSALIAELVARLDGAAVARGRCLPYGRGITFWPLVEITRELAAIAEDDPPEAAFAKLLEAACGNRDVAERIASVTGLLDRPFPVEETFWAVRRLLELTAAERPVVVCFEDIHWAELTLLELIESLHASASGAAILVVCAARPTLAEIRPGWEARVRAQLGGAELPEAVLGRIVAAAEGNPLYVEQIVSTLIEEGTLCERDGRWTATVELQELRIPPTIQALLAARLDLLAAGERAVVEPASVIGHVFPRAAVEALVPEALAPELEAHLASLVRKQLVRPDAAGDVGAYRFHHILIKDAAYQGLLKRSRATLHERFVDWAERVNRDRDRATEYDEILGYHLEQAYRYLEELGTLDEHARALGTRGAEKLAAAGRRAFARGDMPAAANLLRRAAGLRASHDPERLLLLPPLAEALMETGEFAWSEATLDDALEVAAELADERLLADATLTRLLVRHHVADDLAAWRTEVLAESERLIPQLERLDADAELAKAWRLLGFVSGAVCRWGEQVEAVQRALRHARIAGDLRLEARLAAGYTIGLRDGPTTVPEAIARCTEILDRGLHDRQAEAIAAASLACLLAMDGQFEAARSRYRTSRDLLSDLGGAVLAAFPAIAGARVELLAGEPAAAELELAEVYASLGRLGERYFRPLVGAFLARTVQLQGRTAEAGRLVEEAAADADPEDVETQVLVTLVRAIVQADAGDVETAVEGLEPALEAVLATDSPVMQADVIAEAAELLQRAGRIDEAHAALASAHALYEAKGDVVSAARLDERRPVGRG
jgi:class 3 adenylate cyclase/tetratricopeptide (TPR) repeat protein